MVYYQSLRLFLKMLLLYLLRYERPSRVRTLEKYIEKSVLSAELPEVGKAAANHTTPSKKTQKFLTWIRGVTILGIVSKIGNKGVK